MARIGLITDIHEDHEHLHQAWQAFDRYGVDQIVCLGDVFDTGQQLVETAAMMERRPVDCLWGNHDFGLCWQPDQELADRYPADMLSHFAKYRPSLIIADCFFSHVPAQRDPHDLLGLWDTGGWKTTVANLAESFASRPERVLFMGHHHRWLVATEDGQIDWDGRQPIELRPPDRFFVMLGAVCDGWCAVYETDKGVLTPIALTEDATWR